MTGDGRDLEREVADELRLAEASLPDEAMREQLVDRRSDPAETQRYAVRLRGLLDAVEVVHHNGLPRAAESARCPRNPEKENES